VTNRAASVTNNYATMRGELVVIDTTADITIFYGTVDQGETIAGWDGSVQSTPVAQSTGTVFEASVGGLLYNTTYTFRCFATNGAGFSFAQNPLTFTTQGEPPGGPDGVIHVKNGAGGAQNGETWFDAVYTLGAAVAAAAGPTNEIWVANAHEKVITDISIATNLSIYGGFVGDPVTGETLRSQRSTANVTALDGNYSTRLFDITDGTVVLDGLTITNGIEASGQVGHGIRAIGHDSITIASCVIAENGLHDNRDGGGLYVSGGTAYICDTTFEGNSKGHGTQGGGIYAAGNASVTIADSVFTNNHNYGAAVGRQSQGGAIYLSSATLNVTNTIFTGNKVGDQASESQGGGVLYANTGSEAYFKNCVFYDNGNDAGFGVNGPNGGVFHLNGSSPYPTVTVENCTIAFNIADSTIYGGMAYVGCGYFIAINSIMEQNEADTSIASVGDEIYATGTASYVHMSFSNITGTNGNYVVNGGGATITWDSGVIVSNPAFAGDTDFHLKSIGGRWNPVTSAFVFDAETSPCVDSGDPSSDFSQELSPNGGRVNMGAYGNTAEASKPFLSTVTILYFL